jgi:hypothetical protein
MGESVGEEIGEEAVQLARIPLFSAAFGDQDPPNGRVARPGHAEPRSDWSKHSPGFRVRHPEGVEDPQRLYEFALDGRVKGHPRSMRFKSLCG